MIMKYLFVPLVALATAACSGNADSGEPDDRDLAQAICDDLDEGASFFQVHSQAIDHYRSLPDDRSEDAVQLAASELQDLATGELCPDYRAAFEETVMFTDWIEPQQ